MTTRDGTPRGPMPGEHPAGQRELQPLDRELQRLPRSVDPGRDLWPGIAARLHARETPVATTPSRRTAWLAQAAAVVLLVAGSSLLTAKLLDRDRAPGESGRVPAPVASVAAGSSISPAAFGPSGRLDAEYVAAREQLTSMLEARMAGLPASTRAKLAVNLAELRSAAEQINAALAEQPGDPLLEQLLLKTYQDELAVLANVNLLTTAMAATAADKTKRIEL